MPACPNPRTTGKREFKKGMQRFKMESTDFQRSAALFVQLQKSPHLCVLCAHEWKEKGDVNAVGSSVSYRVCLHINAQYKFVNTDV